MSQQLMTENVHFLSFLEIFFVLFTVTYIYKKQNDDMWRRATQDYDIFIENARIHMFLMSCVLVVLTHKTHKILELQQT